LHHIAVEIVVIGNRATHWRNPDCLVEQSQFFDGFRYQPMNDAVGTARAERKFFIG
jgi:hypothetical protein